MKSLYQYFFVISLLDKILKLHALVSMLFFKVSQHTKSDGLADSVNGVNADELAQKMNLLGTGVSIN